MADIVCSGSDYFLLFCKHCTRISFCPKRSTCFRDTSHGGILLSASGGAYCRKRSYFGELIVVMDIFLYLSPFLTGFVISTALLFTARTLFLRMESRFAMPVRRFGGAAVIGSFALSILMNPHLVLTPAILGIIVGSIGILFFGILDDIATLSWKLQLAFQISLGVVLFVSGLRIFSLPVPFVGQVFVDTLPGGEMLGIIVLILWVVFVMNALNWTDGIDGLLPSISIFAFFALFCLSISSRVDQPPLGIIAVVLAGAVLGLLVFNFPPSYFFPGTTGSFFIGFSLASLSILSGAKLATAILVLSLPMLDAIWVFVERLRCGQSPFRGGDLRHLHYRLRELGWSDRAIVSGYAAYTALVGGIALSFGSAGKTIAFLVLSILVGAFLFQVQKRAGLAGSLSASREL